MIIKVKPYSKIYIAAPANHATGGPELLHQLCYNLRNNLNYDALMYYYPGNIANPIHPEYLHYKNPYVRDVVDEEQNILIVPEVSSGIGLLKEGLKIQKYVWWLSVDNYFTSEVLRTKTNFFVKRVFNKISSKLFHKPIFDLNTKIVFNLDFYIKKNAKRIKSLIDGINGNLVQSHYAKEILSRIGTEGENIGYLSDYLNLEFLKRSEFNSKLKMNIVAFNPLKGFAFTRKIISHSKTYNIDFVPIQNMKRTEVLDLLKSAKVYIDFGNHPGKDRLPREAATLGACVITSRRGSAGYFEDVPIPEEYKFEDTKENIPLIVAKIKDCLEHYEQRAKDFDYYREIIAKEPEKFTNDVKKIFIATGQSPSEGNLESTASSMAFMSKSGKSFFG